MPAVVEYIPVSPPPNPPRKRWTRDECLALESAGVLDTSRLELVEGELIERMSKKRPHVTSLLLLRIWLAEVFGQIHVQQEAPIDVAAPDNPSNEPEPDLVVLRRPATSYLAGNPPASDALLVVEVSDSTLPFDRSVKARLYARAAIEDYWVLDVNRRRLLVHRKPVAGEYTDVTVFDERESVSPLAAPGASMPVAAAFPA